MLTSIYLKNFVLIDEASLSFHPGFSVFTGETGAGKSILIDAIGILSGDRLTTEVLKKDSDRLIIEGVFQINSETTRSFLAESGYDTEDNMTVITRELNSLGKSTNRCNGRVVPVSFLRDLSATLIDIHSQHDTQYLLNTKYHRSLLDNYGNYHELFDNVSEKYSLFDSLRKEYRDKVNTSFNPDDLEFIQFQIKEIEDAALKINEDEELETQQKAMMAYEKISLRINHCLELLDDEEGIATKLFDVQKNLSAIEEDPEIVELAHQFDDLFYQIQDKTELLKDYFSKLYFDENELNKIQERLFNIARLKRKYGHTIQEILDIKTELDKRIEMIEHRAEYLADLEVKMAKAEKSYTETALLLREQRKKAALSLEKEITKQLKELYLENARFSVAFTDSDATKYGLDEIEFMISMNSGENLKPLAKVASGGELSRLMLGLKVIFTKLQGIETVIFDEIDSGVSGRVATAIGKKMHDLANNSQVFAVTHLGQVAACGDAHYLVNKLQTSTATHTEIIELDRQKRIEALALIASGHLTAATLSAAEELLKENQLLVAAAT